MKIYLALAVTLGAVALIDALADEELDSMKKQLFEGCRAQEGGSDADTEQLMNHEEPTSREGRCMLACSMEMIGVIRNGKSSLEGKIAIAKVVHPGSEEAIQMAKNVYDDCENVSDGDRCEYAVKLAKCSLASLTRQGYNIKNPA